MTTPRERALEALEQIAAGLSSTGRTITASNIRAAIAALREPSPAVEPERKRLAAMLDEWAEARDEDARLSDPLGNLRDETIRIARDLRRIAAIVRGEPTPGTAIGWRTMESAPRDGTPVLVFVPAWYRGQGGQAVACWMDFSDRPGWYFGSASACEPSAWQPLPPAPPATQQEETRD